MSVHDFKDYRKNPTRGKMRTKPPDNTGTGGGDMDARIAKLEASVGHIEKDVAEIKGDLKGINSRLDGFQTQTNIKFDGFQSQVNSRFDGLHARFDELHRQIIKNYHWQLGIMLVFLIGFFSSFTLLLLKLTPVAPK